ncbi:MAG: hypothetical protein ACYC35_21370 [Pirellulales bacterium]
MLHFSLFLRKRVLKMESAVGSGAPFGVSFVNFDHNGTAGVLPPGCVPEVPKAEVPAVPERLARPAASVMPPWLTAIEDRMTRLEEQAEIAESDKNYLVDSIATVLAGLSTRSAMLDCDCYTEDVQISAIATPVLRARISESLPIAMAAAETPRATNAATTGQKSACEPYRREITDWLARGCSAISIWRELRRRGFEHRPHSVRRFAAKLRSATH